MLQCTTDIYYTLCKREMFRPLLVLYNFFTSIKFFYSLSSFALLRILQLLLLKLLDIAFWLFLLFSGVVLDHPRLSISVHFCGFSSHAQKKTCPVVQQPADPTILHGTSWFLKRQNKYSFSFLSLFRDPISQLSRLLDKRGAKCNLIIREKEQLGFRQSKQFMSNVWRYGWAISLMNDRQSIQYIRIFQSVSCATKNLTNFTIARLHRIFTFIGTTRGQGIIRIVNRCCKNFLTFSFFGRFFRVNKAQILTF